MRKGGSLWHDVRLRQSVNYAINREDLIRYATKGNGLIIPALIPVTGLGYAPDLKPYPFDPAKTRQLLQEAGYADGLTISLIAPKILEVQGTVVSKMLEQVGFTVALRILDPVTYNQQTDLSLLEQPPERQPWDIALTPSLPTLTNFPAYLLYHIFALDGNADWVIEQPELRQLYEQVLATVNEEQQQRIMRQMEQHTRDQAYFLFLYNPIQLYAVNKAVAFEPHQSTILALAETSVTAQHWSVRQQKATVRE
jgi:ABC-type transport system substrate-binding protein